MSKPLAPETARAFFAIPLEAALLEQIRKIQTSLQGRLPNEAARWTQREHLHLTLRFLGDVPVGVIGELTSALERACKSVPPLRLMAGQLGCFPDFRKPRIIWIGIDGDLKHLNELHDRLVSETDSLITHTEDRPFHPHLTIGRVKSSHARVMRQCGETVQAMNIAQIGEWTARQVDLFKSDLSSSGPTHTLLAMAPLETA